MRVPVKVTVIASLLLTLAFPIGAADETPEVDRQVGAKIYVEGRLPDGSPLRAQVLGREITGARAACTTCHRPSGHGVSEGELDVPRVTGPVLFAPLDERRVDLLPALYETPLSKTALARARTPRLRPAYDPESLARAITTGIDASGRPLHRGMPRYRLDGKALDALIAFLDGLGRGDAPGIGETKIHFATVIAGDIAAEREAAIRAVIDGFVRQYNFEQEALNLHLGRFRYRKDLYAGARRQWRVHIWRLEGPPENWGAELAAHYAAQPVFAFLGGTAKGSWVPMHRFCEANEIPCLFPDTNLPAAADFWTVYFSEGLPLEAEMAALWLSQHSMLPSGDPILQVTGDGDEPEAFAGMFANAIDQSPVLDLQSFRPGSLPDSCPGIALIWVSEKQAPIIDAMAERCGGRTLVIVSGGLLGENEAWRLREAWPAIGMTYPFALAQRHNPDAVRHRGWLRSQGIESRDPLAEARTYFALDAARHALKHIVDRFSRAYFLERIEHVAENLPNPGLYDRFSLGAGQRFAVKGIYVFPSDDPNAKEKWMVR